MRVLEIGCGSGVAARAVLRRVGDGYVLGIDRSAKAIAQAVAGSRRELATGRLEYRCVAIEEFVLAQGEPHFDLAFAVRVGALDGRHPEAQAKARPRLYAALAPGGRIFVDGVESTPAIASPTPRRESTDAGDTTGTRPLPDTPEILEAVAEVVKVSRAGSRK
ncbi:MAG: class I SAM-dependent methyltransferase [Thermaceae bacterium]|nr:class I SAM-dependent methyltransferase [Thermaceae bacterium]